MRGKGRGHSRPLPAGERVRCRLIRWLSWVGFDWRRTAEKIGLARERVETVLDKPARGLERPLVARARHFDGLAPQEDTSREWQRKDETVPAPQNVPASHGVGAGKYRYTRELRGTHDTRTRAHAGPSRPIGREAGA